MVSAPAGVNVVDHGDYEEWIIPAGSHPVVHVGTGETLENVLIDWTANNCRITITTWGQAPANNFTIRNIGFRGTANYDRSLMDNPRFALITGTTGGTGVVENIFADNHDIPGNDNRWGCMYVANGHSGRLELRNNYIGGFGHNAFYGSAPGQNNGGGGQVVVLDSFHENNTVANFRIGTQGSIVERCVGVTDDPECRRGNYLHDDNSKGSPGVLCQNWYGQEVRRCSFAIYPDACPSGVGPNNPLFIANALGATDGPYAALDVYDTHVEPGSSTEIHEREPTDDITVHGGLGNDATVDVIENGGIPTSPEEAARGNRHTPYDISPFSLDEGKGEPGPDPDPDPDPEVTVEALPVEGLSPDGATFVGEVTHLSGVGEAEVHFEWGPSVSDFPNQSDSFVVGTHQFRWEPDFLQPGETYEYRSVAVADGAESVSGAEQFTVPERDRVPEDYDYALIVDGQTASDIGEYEFEVRGTVTPAEMFGGTVNEDITIERDGGVTYVHNHIANIANTYLIDGCIDRFDHLDGHVPDFYRTRGTENDAQPIDLDTIPDCVDEEPTDPSGAGMYLLAIGLAAAAAREYNRRRG